MGILGPPSTFQLNYSGRGCGGCCLPFDAVHDAIRYAGKRGATSYTVEDAAGSVVVRGERKDCRHRFTTTTKGTVAGGA